MENLENDEIIYENKNVPNDINMVDADELSYALSKKEMCYKNNSKRY